MRRGIRTEIDLRAAAHNLSIVKKLTSNRPVIAVVKANAYGHGAVRLSEAFVKAGASALAVAFVSEAIEIREAGIQIPIIVLFDSTDLPDYFKFKLIPVVHDLKTARAFSKEASKRNLNLDVHLKADTGMGRLGFSDEKDLTRAAFLPNLKTSGLMSHFSEADLADKDLIEAQLEKLKSIKACLAKQGLRPLCHMANSAAVLSMKESHLDAVRPGLVLYGCNPFPDKSDRLKPVMKAKASVLSVRKLGKGHPVSYGKTFITNRPTLAAVIAAGYADGYIRAASNKSHIVIKKKKFPVIGRVCMDLMVVDVTGADVKEGDEAVLLGEGISAWEIARASGTIPYEILTSFGRKSEKSYR